MRGWLDGCEGKKYGQLKSVVASRTDLEHTSKEAARMLAAMTLCSTLLSTPQEKLSKRAEASRLYAVSQLHLELESLPATLSEKIASATKPLAADGSKGASVAPTAAGPGSLPPAAASEGSKPKGARRLSLRKHDSADTCPGALAAASMFGPAFPVWYL